MTFVGAGAALILLLATNSLAQTPQVFTRAEVEQWLNKYRDAKPDFKPGDVISGGDLMLDADRVAFVGPRYDGSADRVLDATGRLVSPGFVNLHCQVDASHGPLWYDAERLNIYTLQPDAWLRDPNEAPVLTPDEQKALEAQLDTLQATREKAVQRGIEKGK